MCAPAASVLGHGSQLGGTLSAGVEPAPERATGDQCAAAVIAAAARASGVTARSRPERTGGLVGCTDAGCAGYAGCRRAPRAEHSAATVSCADPSDHGLGPSDAIRQSHAWAVFA